MDTQTLYQSLPSVITDYDTLAWHPESELDLALHIDQRGDWWQGDEMIRNQKIRSLFSRLLVKRNNHYWLVTPNVKFPVHVSGIPLRVVDLSAQNSRILLALSDGRTLEVSSNSLRTFCLLSGEDCLLVELPNGCEAQVTRQLYYRLVEQATLLDQHRLCWHNVIIGYIFG